MVLVCKLLGSVGGVALGELALEALDTAGRVDDLVLARVERVADVADFEEDVALVGGLRLKAVAAGALYSGRDVVRVDSLLRHCEYSTL